MELPRLDARQPRRLHGPGRRLERRAVDDRYLAHEGASTSLADLALDAVDPLDHVKPPREHGIERRLVALMHHELSRADADVAGSLSSARSTASPSAWNMESAARSAAASMTKPG